MAVYRYEIEENEYWWGGAVEDAYLMPFSKSTEYSIDLTRNMTYNQAVPLYLSSKGRYIWSDAGFAIRFSNGEIHIESEFFVEFGKSETATLRGAFLAAQKHFMPDGRFPDATMFKVPQYCTWIELLKNQTQEGVLRYARNILKSGMPAGEIIIDNGWQCDFGMWDFDRLKFPDPAEMCKELHDLGFKVILWVVPYVSPDCASYHVLNEGNMLIRTPQGKPFLAEWWEGWSAVLDFSDTRAVDWFYSQCTRLMKDYGVDGFKQDGGDAMFLTDEIVCAEKGCTANRQSELYALSALKFSFNELRACFRCGGKGIAQRISDRHHVWDRQYGLGSLVPNATVQGLLGYAFVCPDMVGGGLSGDFDGKSSDSLDTELFVRSCQCSTFMPMMQLSYAFWSAFDKDISDICIKYCLLHASLHDYMMECVRAAAKTGEPIVRNMAYEFGKGELISDQFTIGGRYLVTPVLEKGATSRKVSLFEGKWRYVPTGEIYEAGEYEIPTPLDILPYFERI